MLISVLCGCSGESVTEYSTAKVSDPEITNTPEPSYWSIKYYVDEFGDKTDRFYVGSDKFDGTFSNTAENNAALTVSVIYDEVDRTGFRFSLLEYRRTPAFHTSLDEMTLKFKIDDAVYSCNLRSGDSVTSDVFTGMDDLTTEEVDALYAFRGALLDGKLFDCIIYIGESKYQFRIPTEGFYSAIAEYIDLVPAE